MHLDETKKQQAATQSRYDKKNWAKPECIEGLADGREAYGMCISSCMGCDNLNNKLRPHKPSELLKTVALLNDKIQGNSEQRGQAPLHSSHMCPRTQLASHAVVRTSKHYSLSVVLTEI